jgi:hypothetical protein
MTRLTQPAFHGPIAAAFCLRQAFDTRFPPLVKLGNRLTRGTNRGTSLFTVFRFSAPRGKTEHKK